MHRPVIRLDRHAALEPCRTIDPANLESGTPQEAIRQFGVADDGRFTVGIWSCTPEKDRIAEFPVDEFCVILEGVVELIDEAGHAERFVAGDAFFVPRGFRGWWHTLEPVRKLYAIYDRSAA